MDDGQNSGLEDLSQDVYLFGRVRLRHVFWLAPAALAGLLLAAAPLPLPARLVLLALPLAATAAFLNADGPVWARRWREYRERARRREHGLFVPDAEAIGETVTPLCDLGGGRYLAAAELTLPPFHLAGTDERARRTAGWAALSNTAAAHAVQVDVFTAHGPMADAGALLAGGGAWTGGREGGGVHGGAGASGDPEREPAATADGPARGAGPSADAMTTALRAVGAERARHFARRAAEAGYDTRVVVRLVAGAQDAADAWQRFRACEVALASAGAAWEWVAGGYLLALSQEWMDPGAAVRRMVARVEKVFS